LSGITDPGNVSLQLYEAFESHPPFMKPQSRTFLDLDQGDPISLLIRWG
jgi:hypothetical protein